MTIIDSLTTLLHFPDAHTNQWQNHWIHITTFKDLCLDIKEANNVICSYWWVEWIWFFLIMCKVWWCVLTFPVWGHTPASLFFWQGHFWGSPAPSFPHSGRQSWPVGGKDTPLPLMTRTKINLYKPKPNKIQIQHRFTIIKRTLILDASFITKVDS